MQTLPITVDETGVLRLPPQTKLSEKAKLAVLILTPAEAGDDEPTGEEIARLAQSSGAFDFLHAEPDLYTTDDVKPDRRNPQFAFRADVSPR